MSWSFTVPAVPAKQFTQGAMAAKKVYEDNLAGQDYMLAQFASGQADEAIKAAQAVIDSGVLGDGNVSASFSGHAVVSDPAAATAVSTQSVSIVLSCAPFTQAQQAAMAAEEAAPADPEPSSQPAPTTEAAPPESAAPAAE